MASHDSFGFGDIRAPGGFLESARQASLTVVTSNYHTRRVRWTVARVLGERARQVTFVSAPTDEFQMDNWWQRDEGFKAIVGEYLKLTYYVLRYTRICYWIAGGGALLLIGLAYRRFRTAPM